VYDTVYETVHLIHSDGSRERKVLGTHTINDWIDAVDDAYGWDSQRLFKSLADSLTASIE